MKKGKIVLGLCGFCLLLSSCGSSQNATVGNNTDPNNHSVSTTSMSRETSDIQYLKKDLENGTVSEDNFALCGEPLKIHVPAGSETEARLQEIMKSNDDLNIQIVEE